MTCEEFRVFYSASVQHHADEIPAHGHYRSCPDCRAWVQFQIEVARISPAAGAVDVARECEDRRLDRARELDRERLARREEMQAPEEEGT